MPPITSANKRRGKYEWLAWLFVIVTGVVMVWKHRAANPAARSTISVPNEVLNGNLDRQAPDPDWLESHRSQVVITPDQERSLKPIRDSWNHHNKPLATELEKARAEMAPYAGDHTLVQISRIRNKGLSIIGMSHVLEEARQGWWIDARKILTTNQSEEAYKIWQAERKPR